MGFSSVNHPYWDWGSPIYGKKPAHVMPWTVAACDPWASRCGRSALRLLARRQPRLAGDGYGGSGEEPAIMILHDISTSDLLSLEVEMEFHGLENPPYSPYSIWKLTCGFLDRMEHLRILCLSLKGDYGSPGGIFSGWSQALPFSPL